MAELRIGKGWTEEELEGRLDHLRSLERNFSESSDQLTLERGWHQYYSESVVGHENPGVPVQNGPFERGRIALANYQFSDPRIVIGHFDPSAPLNGRHMLLEMRALRALHYLAGVVVSAVRDENSEETSVFGFRYETLQGHIEKGIEWFLLTKNLQTGEIHFRIEAAWRPGQFPNWWSRVGFSWLGPYYQKKWHYRAHLLLSHLMHDPSLTPPEPGENRLIHTTPEVVFRRTYARIS